MAALKVVHGEGLAESFPLRVGMTLIGRSVDCDIVLQNSAVSRKHARISSTDAGYEIKDLSSRNGVVVNRRPIAGATLLANGDTIQICNFVFCFVEEPSNESTAVEP